MGTYGIFEVITANNALWTATIPGPEGLSLIGLVVVALVAIGLVGQMASPAAHPA